jgi:outer membrane protein assembly factor BamB
MRRLGPLLLLLCLLNQSLISCAPGPVSPHPATPASTAATASPFTPQAARPSDTSSPTRAPSSTSTHSSTPSPTPTLTPRTTPSPTPSPTLPAAVAPLDGEPLAFHLGWRFDANAHITAAATMRTSDKPLILLSWLGRTIYALDSGGRPRWQAKTEGPTYALAALADGRVAVADDAGWVTLLDARGSEAWKHKLGSRGTVLQPGPLDGVFAAGWDEQLTLLDDHGQIVWQAGLNGPAMAIATQASAETEQVIAAVAGHQIQAFSPDGTQLWQFDAGVPLVGLSTAHEGNIGLLLVSAQDGRLLALDQKGALRWQRSLGVGAPILYVVEAEMGESPGTIFAGTGGDRPTLTCLSARGDVRWRIMVPAPVGAILSVDLDRDGAMEVLVGLTSGLVQAYDGSGRFRGAIHAGLAVWGLHVVGDQIVVARADVIAWEIAAGPGPADGPWLPPPAMLPVSTTTLPLDTERKEEGAALVFLGDLTFGRSVEFQMARYGPDYPWQGLAPLLDTGAQTSTEPNALPVIVAANLEGVLTTRGMPLNKRYLIRAHPRWGQALVQAGIDLVTVANNHALDYGPEGLDDTLGTLDALDIASVGTGPAQRPVLLTENGVRVAFLGYAAARWNGSVDVPATQSLAWAKPGAVQADVRAARKEADVVVVLLHAGTEYATEPSADQVAVAHAAVDAGADLVVGHHPHVTQTVERYGNGLIVYSLGDALFDIPRSAAMRGDLLRVHVTADGLARAELWPFWIEDTIRPRLLADEEGQPQFRAIYP